MKRLLLSVLGGFLIPFIYTAITGPLSTYIENRTVHKLLTLPVRWPIVLIMRLVPLNSFIFRDEYLPALFIFVIIADVLLYSVLTYLLLWRFWKRRPDASLPPEPPEFATQ